MPHEAQDQIHLAIGAPVTSQKALAFVVTPTLAISLRGALRNDAKDYVYSAAVSLLDSIRGIDNGFFTWATVKAYYSVFYSTRALLALDGALLFHCGRSPHMVLATAGSTPVKRAGQTHQATLLLFEERAATHFLLSQQINLRPPIRWLMNEREVCNYGLSRFCEPDAPDRYARIDTIGVRKALESYLATGGDVYAFDPDHAMLAFPALALRYACRALAAIGQKVQPTDDEVTFFRSKCRDRDGHVPSLSNLMKEGMDW